MSLLKLAAGMLVITLASVHAYASNIADMSIEKAIELAVQNDPWLTANKFREAGLLDNSIAANTLPEPVMSVGLANLPTNGFAFDQEPMTQLKFGVAQMFPKGDSLAIKSQQLRQSAQQYPYLREDRIAQLRVTVTTLWLDVFQAQQSIALIEQDRQLFAQLSEIAQASYSSALGNVRQQDIIRAQLELSRLDDKLTRLRSQEQKATALLMEWLAPSEFDWVDNQTAQLPVSAIQQQVANIPMNIKLALDKNEQQSLVSLLQLHPNIISVDQRIRASNSGVELAKQDYQPQWGVNASYALRADDKAGASRADFFSVGLTFQVPLFSSTKQDSLVSAAVNEREAIKTDKRLKLRSMLYTLKSIYAEYQGLQERQERYKNAILIQMREQAEASLTAYTNDDGDFAEVARARIADLNGRIEALNIDLDLLKTRAKLGYFLTQSQNHPSTFSEQLP